MRIVGREVGKGVEWGEEGEREGGIGEGKVGERGRQGMRGVQGEMGGYGKGNRGSGGKRER